MASSDRCKECGTAIPADGPGRFCAQCLLGLGLNAQGESGAEPITDPAVSPSALRTPHSTLIQYFGDYELLERIAQGGMGIVFKARQVSLNRFVALKLISAGALATSELVKRFKAEAEAAASLSHPNIVPIHEIGEHEGQHYFSMGLIEGPNLREALAPERRGSHQFSVFSNQSDATHRALNTENWSLTTSAKLVSTIARAVHYAHQRGVLHRDIKPSNILLDASGTPHLTDFGLAKLVEKESTLTHTNAVMGTPAYMAPEQARGGTRDVTTAADIYGLGAVLYETLTGSPPFAGGTSMETIRQVLDQEPRRPSFFNHAIDRDLETICLKCLEKEPARRYASAETLADDLDRWLQSEPIAARQVSNYERVKKWLRRRPAIAALGTLSLISLLALAMSSTVAALRITSAKNVLRRNLYASDMNVAFQSLEGGEVERARTLLQNQLPQRGDQDLRGWEWRYLWSRARPQELDEWKSPSGSVMSLAYSPEGPLVSYGGDRIRWWNAVTRQPVVEFPGDYGWGYRLAFSADGGLLLTTHASEGRIRVWDARTHQLLGMFTNHHQMVVCAAFTPDGKAVVSAAGTAYSTNSPGELKLWEASTFREIGDFERIEIPLVWCDVSSDGRLVAASGAGPTVQVWDLRSRQPVARLTGHQTKSSGGVFGLRFSPDGRFLATADFVGTVRLWNLQTREALVLGSHAGPAASLVFSPDGRRLASSSSDHTVKLWDVATPGESATLRGHATRVWSVAFAMDGKTIATGDENGTVKFWSATQPPDGNVFARNNGHGPVGYSADGRFLAWQDSGFKVVTLWDLPSSNLMLRIPGQSFTFSPTSNALVVISPTKKLQWWNLDPLTEMKGPDDPTEGAAGWTSKTFSPRGDRLAAVDAAGNIHLWRVEGWSKLSTIKAGAVWVRFAGDGQLLVVFGSANDAALWNLAIPKHIGTFRGHSSHISSAALSPDGRLLVTGSKDTTVRLWEIATQRELAKYAGGSGVIQSVEFSRDGKTIAAGSGEGVIQLWNIASGQQVGVLEGHVSFVNALAFSPDGSALASSSMDKTLRLWRAATWQEIIRTEASRR